MIVFLNGPFGVGKTTVARRLVSLLPGAMLYDPELVGVLVRRLLADIDPRDDFQDYTIWRALVIDVARRLRETQTGPLIVPMTIWRRDYFDEIVGGFRAVDPVLVAVHLTAHRDVLVRRILGRPETEGSHGWCLRHLDACLAAAADPHFGIAVSTDERTPLQIAQAILALLPEASAGG